jgi:hypothetical protein
MDGVAQPTNSPTAPWAYLALAAVVAAGMLRAGDVQFVNDEPQLLYLAVKCNRTPSRTYGISLPFTLSPIGLQGTRGARYGPLPVWVYQLLLAICGDLLMVVRLHALLVGGITAVALAWLARTMRVSVWLAVVTMLSPWIWLYDRQLWDNSFNICLSAMALAAYGDFLTRGRSWSLWLAGWCALCMVLVHLMCLAILAPLAIHLAALGWRSARRRAAALGGLAGVAAILGGVSWPYWYYLFRHYSPNIPGDSSLWAGWFFPLLGGHHLTAAGLGNILGDDWQYTTGRVLPYLIVAAQTISLAAYPAVWAGMILAIRSCRRVLRGYSDATPADHLAAIALGTWICQSLLDGNRRVSDGPQYFNATWIAYMIFAWMAADALWRAGQLRTPSPGTPDFGEPSRTGEGRGEGSFYGPTRPSPYPLPAYRERGMRTVHRSVLVRAALPVYAAALIIVLGSMIWKIARDGGAWSENYGVALSEQLRAFRQIQQFSDDSPRQISVRQWTDHPWVLDKDFPALVPAPPGPRPRRQIVVGYRSAFPGDVLLMVQDLPLAGPTSNP